MKILRPKGTWGLGAETLEGSEGAKKQTPPRTLKETQTEGGRGSLWSGTSPGPSEGRTL